MEHVLSRLSTAAPTAGRSFLRRSRKSITAWFEAWCWRAEQPRRQVPYY